MYTNQARSASELRIICMFHMVHSAFPKDLLNVKDKNRENLWSMQLTNNYAKDAFIVSMMSLLQTVQLNFFLFNDVNQLIDDNSDKKNDNRQANKCTTFTISTTIFRFVHNFYA